MNIRKKVVATLLALSVFGVTLIGTCNEAYATGADIVIGGAAAVSAGELIAYLLGAFGLTAASVAVYDNVDSIKAWGNDQLEAFQTATVDKLSDPAAQAQAREDIAAWVENARKGLIDNSSVVWSYWKQWAGSLTTQTIGQTTGGVGGLPVYAALTSDPVFESVMQFTMKSSSEPVYALGVCGHSGGIYYYLVSMARFSFRYYDGYNGKFYDNVSFDNVMRTGDYYGTRYYYYNIITSDVHSDVSSVFGVPTSALIQNTSSPPSESLEEFLINNVLNPPVVETPDYTLSPTGLSDVYERDHNYDNVGLVNPGAVAGNPGITIDWGKVGDIAGVLGGIAAGELDGTAALERVGVTAVDRVTDMVIDDTGVTDIPIADVVVDTTAVDDYTIPGLQTLFPFCLPFDLIDFISVLSAPPVAPHFQIPIRYPTGSGWAEYIVDIDLSAFDSVAVILRNMELLAFCVGLILLTRDKMIRG